MRRRARSSGDDAADVNVTPLLDIVFIMLIFFIVTATFVFEKGIEPNLPQASEEKPTKPTPSLVLAVTEDGGVIVDNVRQIDPRSVKPVVEEFLAKEPKGNVLISASVGSKTGTVTVVLDQARLAAGPERYNSISLAKAGA